MVKQFFYKAMGETIGPVTGDEVKQLVRAGEVTPDTHLKAGNGEWFLAGSSKSLFPPKGSDGKEELGVTCPHCNRVLKCSGQAGQEIRCPSCNGVLALPKAVSTVSFPSVDRGFDTRYRKMAEQERKPRGTHPAVWVAVILGVLLAVGVGVYLAGQSMQVAAENKPTRLNGNAPGEGVNPRVELKRIIDAAIERVPDVLRKKTDPKQNPTFHSQNLGGHFVQRKVYDGGGSSVTSIKCFVQDYDFDQAAGTATITIEFATTQNISSTVVNDRNHFARRVTVHLLYDNEKFVVDKLTVMIQSDYDGPWKDLGLARVAQPEVDELLNGLVEM